MSMLLAQIFALMLGAFLAGASLACVLRRSIFGTTTAASTAAAATAAAAASAPALTTLAPETAAPAPRAPADPAATGRFERALNGGADAVPLPFQSSKGPVVEVQAPSATKAAPAPAVAKSEPAAPAAKPAAPAPAPSPVAAKPEPAPAPAPASPPQEKPAPAATRSSEQSYTAVAVAAAAAAAAAASATARQAATPAPAEATPAEAPRPAAPAVIAPDAPIAPATGAGNSYTAIAVAAAAAAAASKAFEPAPAATPPPLAASDDLTRIRSIDLDTQRRLSEFGVRRFADIASWSPEDVTRMNQSLGFYGRIEQENWIEQAQILAKGGETDYSRRREPIAPAAAAIAGGAAAGLARSDSLANLRSVRSEALRGEPVSTGERSGALDDLKRIRGIGVLIEKKLNSLGITSYEEVANWTGADIDRVSQMLDFKGRIERENWVEQARILASGGQTEFSRRADRGEIY